MKFFGRNQDLRPTRRVHISPSDLNLMLSIIAGLDADRYQEPPAARLLILGVQDVERAYKRGEHVTLWVDQ